MSRFNKPILFPITVSVDSYADGLDGHRYFLFTNKLTGQPLGHVSILRIEAWQTPERKMVLYTENFSPSEIRRSQYLLLSHIY